MDVFLQTLLGSVMLNQHVEGDSYYKYFSGWISRSQHKWGVMTTREYQNAVGRSEEYLLTTTGDSERKVQLNISDRSLPWLVLSCHVLLGFTSNAAQISELLVFCGFRRVSEEVIQSIVEWSTYPARLGLTSTCQNFCLKAFEELQKAHANMEPNEEESLYISWRKVGYPLFMWKTIFDHHLSTPGLNSMSNTAGIVFYALVWLDDDLYAVLFIDAVTEALQFSRRYRGDDATKMANRTADAIAAYMDMYGHPKYFVLLNPLRGWLHRIMVKALSALTVLSACKFIAPRQLTANTKISPTMVENLLASIQLLLRDESLMKGVPPFNLLNSDDSWPSVFAEHMHWTQNMLSSTHPSGLAQKFQNDPDFGYGKELKVVDLPSLETGEISARSFELLNCRAPEGKKERGDTLVLPEEPNEDLNEDFAALMKRSGEFNLRSGKDCQAAPVDYISRKMILHIWQCFMHRKTTAGNGQDRQIDFEDMVHVLSRGHDVYKVIGVEEARWQPKGVELVRAEDGSIRVVIATDSPSEQVTWWEDGDLGGDVFLHDTVVSFLPKTVEEAVEDGRRRYASIQLSESDDDDSDNAAGVTAKQTSRRALRESKRQGGSVGPEDSSVDDSGLAYNGTAVPEFAPPTPRELFTTTQLPSHLRSLYDDIDPGIQESLYDKSNPLIRSMTEHALSMDVNMKQPKFYDIRSALESEDDTEDVEMNGS